MAKYQLCVYLKHTTFQENNLKEGKKSHMFIGNKLVNINGPMNLKTKIKATKKLEKKNVHRKLWLFNSQKIEGRITISLLCS